ncbi:MAG TPA: AarF/UbiB family protein [Pyrinomonadaceae bacterium]|nr:AarF/UbiB family protein [Pyrinomonadaceae bacterium]
MAVEGFSKTTRSTLKRRREEVSARIAACGLARAPQRVARVAGIEESHSRKLRLALEGLGPVFSAFGRYLATRVDLLPASDCLELAAIPDRAPPAAPAIARDVFRRELGSPPGEAFPVFEERPFESRLLYQAHRASLPNGAPVEVRIIRPETEQAFLLDVELLPLLEGALAVMAPGGVGSFRSALADFTVALGQQLDFTHEAKAFETLARDAEEIEMLRVPEVYRGLCAPGVLTVEELIGIRLDQTGGLPGAAGARGRGGLPAGFDRTSLARLICSVWLRQALLGHVFPADPTPENVFILSERRIAFTGGLFAGLPTESQSNLQNYLIATASENPDIACSCLLREVRSEGATNDEELRHRFRQVVPFRDSEWHRDDDINHLVEHLVVHWRAGGECGYVPLPHLPSFYRGLFTVTQSAQRLFPERDPLREGLQDTRLLASLEEVREMMSLRQFGNQMDKYAALMMGMPQRFDQMLTLASEGSARVRLHVPESATHQRQKNSTAVTTALLLVLAAVALALPRITAALVAEVWANRINAFVFIACGAFLLRAAGRAR